MCAIPQMKKLMTNLEELCNPLGPLLSKDKVWVWGFGEKKTTKLSGKKKTMQTIAEKTSKSSFEDCARRK